MTQIPFTFDLVETNAQIVTLILLEIAKQLNRKIPPRMSRIDKRMREATVDYFRGTSTYRALVGGSLAGHFGLPIAGRQDRIDTIIKAVAYRMEIEFVPIVLRGKNYDGNIRFRVLLKDLSEVLNLPEASIITEKGQVLDWLRWLLEHGDRIIISEYDVFFRPGKGRSRQAIMIPEKGGSWHVPTIYAGTRSDNWLTRALIDNSQSYLSIIENIIRDELQRIT